MTINIPGPLKAIASVVVGSDWPEADEDSLWRLQDGYSSAAASVTDLAQLGDDAARRVLGCVDGDIAGAFEKYWQGLERDAFPQLTDMLNAAGDECDEFAMQTEHAKLSIIGALIGLAAEIAALVATSFATFGAASAGIPVAEAATQVVVKEVLKDLLVEVLKGVATNVAVEGAIQGYQLAEHGTHAFSAANFGEAALAGALAGATGKLTGDSSSALFGATSRSGVGAAARGAAEDAVSGVFANVANKDLHGEPTSLQDLYSGAASGAVSGARAGLGNRVDGLQQTAYTRDSGDFSFGQGDRGLVGSRYGGLTDDPVTVTAPNPTTSGPGGNGPGQNGSGPTPGPAPAPPAPGWLSPPPPAPGQTGPAAPTPGTSIGYDGYSFGTAAKVNGRIQDRPDVVDGRDD